MVERSEVSNRATARVGTTWYRELPPDVRQALRQLSHVEPRYNVVVLGFVTLWAAAYAAMTAWPVWPVRFAGYLLIGAVLHAFGVLVHEAVHGNLFRQRSLDRWAGFLLGVPVLISAEAYRVAHLVHHRHTRDPDDPDDLAFRIKNPRGRSVAFYLLGLIGLFVFLVHVPHQGLRHGSGRQRVRIAGEYAAIACIYAVVLLVALRQDGMVHIVHGWVLPAVVTLAVVNVRGWAEHLLTEPGHPLTRSRTVTSNAPMSLLMCNVNYHLEHHLLPGVPWYNLPRMHAVLRPTYEEAGAFIYSSYLHFLWDAVRTGVHGLAPERSAAHGSTGTWRSTS